jgi:hypothetical protein
MSAPGVLSGGLLALAMTVSFARLLDAWSAQ